MSTPSEVKVATASGQSFTFMFDDCLHHHGEFALAAMRNSANCGTELGVGLRWPDPIIGRRHAVLASCVGTSRQEALVTGCFSLAEWIEAQRAKMHPKPGAMPRSNELPEGWERYRDSGAVRLRDGCMLRLAVDPGLWASTIRDFEFREGTKWTPEQIDVIRGEAAEGVPSVILVPLSEYVPPSVDPARCAAKAYESAVGSALKAQLVKTHSLMRSIAGAAPGLDARMKANRETPPNTDKTFPFVLLNYMADDLKESATETSDYPGYEGGDIVALGAQHIGGAAQQVPVASVYPSPTEAMLVRGKEAKALFGLGAFASAVTEEEAIYRAMATVAPVELVSAGERAALRERDEALAKAAYFEAEAFRLANGPPTRHPPEFVAKVLMDREGRHDDPMALARLTEVIRCARLDGRKQARDELAAKDTRIAELKTILAEKVKSETPSDTKPAPAPKEFPAAALKANGGDPRRMGPT